MFPYLGEQTVKVRETGKETDKGVVAGTAFGRIVFLIS